MARHFFGIALLVHGALAAAPSPVNSGTPVQVWPCTAGSVRQTWVITRAGRPHDHIELGGVGIVPLQNLRLNTLGFSNVTGGVINVWVPADSSPWGEMWTYDASTLHIRNELNGLCAGTLNSTGSLPAGTAVVQVPCASVTAAQWTYVPATGAFTWGEDATLCLDAGATASCGAPPLAGAIFCNTSYSVAARTEDLISRLQPVEAVSMLAADNNGVPRLGVPPLRFGEALHGVLSGCGAAVPGSTGCPTSFPTGVALGSSFNNTLFSLVGRAIGTEARALFNQGVAGSAFFTPDINPFRDPRWGRGMEVAGEDPLLCGRFASHYIASFQGTDTGGELFLSIAMPKHGLVYDQEGNGGVHDRTHFCAPVSTHAFVSYFLPPFRAALVEGKAGGMMCSANGYGFDGAPGHASCAHADVQNGIYRDEWGWEGAIVTDGNGIGYLWQTYGQGMGALDCNQVDGATGPTSAVRVGLRGGTDIELGETYHQYALDAIADGNITMDDVHTALRRSLPFIFRLGLLDDPASVPWSSLGPADVDTPAHRALAFEAGVQSIILLRNNASNARGDAPLLPLSLSTAGLPKGIAVIGPSGDSSYIQLANYHGASPLADDHTPLRALSAAASAAGVALTYTPGCSSVLCVDDSGIAAAVTAASAASVVVLIGGNAPWRGGPNAFNSTEGEEFDRLGLTLSGTQEELITRVLETGTPCIVVLMRGGPIALSPTLLAHPLLTTLVDSPFPGELGGDALAAVLLGDVAPSGRLSVTVYPASFNESRSITDYDFSSGDGVTYQYYTGAPQWPFGFGGSYTTWSLSFFGDSDRALIVPDARAWVSGAASPPHTAVNVTNTGTVTSDISVLAFLSTGIPGDPLSQLFDFARASMVSPGDTRTLFFTVPLDIAARVGRDGEVTLHRGVQVMRVGLPGEQMLEGSLEIGLSDGEAVVVHAAPRLSR